MKTVITILFIYGAGLLGYGTKINLDTPGCKDIDVMVLADLSWSVEGRENYIADAIYALGENVSEGQQMGLVRFGTDAELLGEMTEEKEKILGGMGKLQGARAYGTTNLMDAFYMAVDEFGKRGRVGVKKMIIVVSDGLPNNPDGCLVVVEQIKLMDIDIYTVLIGNNEKGELFMQYISTQYFASDYEGLSRTLQSINMCL